MKRMMLWLCAAVLAYGCFSVPAPQTRAQSKPESAETKPPVFEIEEYQFALLKRGPKWTAESSPEVDKLQAGHMANIQLMARLGKLMAAGPLGKNDAGLAGVFIFKAPLDEAKTLAAEDPAIKAGRLAIDFYLWRGPKQIGVRLNEAYRQDPNTKMTMAKQYLALLKRGDKWSNESTPATQQLQTSHLWHIRRMLDAKKYLAAGPFGGNGDILGIVVIDASTLDDAKALAEADPAVKAGRLRAEYVEWYCAKEVWP